MVRRLFANLREAPALSKVNRVIERLKAFGFVSLDHVYGLDVDDLVYGFELEEEVGFALIDLARQASSPCHRRERKQGGPYSEK